MESSKRHSDQADKTSCFKLGKPLANHARQMAKTSLLCAAFAVTSMASAQDTIAMVDHSVSVSGSQVAPVAVSAVQGLNTDAVVPAVSSAEQDGKSPITGLEPGTLALIGFGLLALAATRRNAR